MKKCVPNKFLWRYPLAIGAIVAGIILIIVKVVCLVATVMVMVDFSYCNTNCTSFVSNNAYGFNVTAMIYIIIMILVHLCFLWAIKKKKSAYIIGWVAITTLWFIATVCLMVVLLCLYSKQNTFVNFIVCVVFAVIGFCIVAYFLFVAFGFWREIQEENTVENPQD